MELGFLCDAQPAWSATTKAERANVAREILAELAKDEWSTAGDWVAKEMELQRVNEPGLGAASRFVFGSLIKDFCLSIVAAAEGKALPQLPAAVDGSSRFEVKLGMGAPGFSAELWTAGAAVTDGAPSTPETFIKPSTSEATWRGGLPCAPGTVSLVLGAGNQGFLSLVEALGRCLLHGDVVMVKHHPLRPWMEAPYAAILAPLIRRGLLAQTRDAGVAASTALLVDPRVGHVSLIGSEATATAVRRVLDDAGKVAVGLSSELGCATPVIVAGGAWTAHPNPALALAPTPTLTPTPTPTRRVERHGAAARRPAESKPDRAGRPALPKRLAGRGWLNLCSDA